MIWRSQGLQVIAKTGKTPYRLDISPVTHTAKMAKEEDDQKERTRGPIC